MWSGSSTLRARRFWWVIGSHGSIRSRKCHVPGELEREKLIVYWVWIQRRKTWRWQVKVGSQSGSKSLCVSNCSDLWQEGKGSSNGQALRWVTGLLGPLKGSEKRCKWKWPPGNLIQGSCLHDSNIWFSKCLLGGHWGNLREGHESKNWRRGSANRRSGHPTPQAAPHGNSSIKTKCSGTVTQCLGFKISSAIWDKVLHPSVSQLIHLCNGTDANHHHTEAHYILLQRIRY